VTEGKVENEDNIDASATTVTQAEDEPLLTEPHCDNAPVIGPANNNEAVTMVNVVTEGDTDARPAAATEDADEHLLTEPECATSRV
jgi:hypothetical protein